MNMTFYCFSKSLIFRDTETDGRGLTAYRKPFIAAQNVIKTQEY